MNYILAVALIIFSTSACTDNDHTRRVRKSVEDENKKIIIEEDGKTLSIKIKVKNAENPIDYNKSFDVKNMNDMQKEKLENHILDSLGVKIK